MGLFDNIFKRRTDYSDLFEYFRYFTFLNSKSFDVNQKQLLEEGYETNVDVYAVIKKIVDTSKAVPWIVEQQNSDGEWELLEDTTLHELMENPNPDKGYTWDDIEEMIVTYLLATGNSYMVGQDGIISTTIREVDVLPSPFVEANASTNFFIPNQSYTFEMNTQKRTFQKEEIEHIMFFNPSYSSVEESFNGLSIIEVARKVVEAGNNRWTADSHMLKNKGIAGMLTDASNHPMTGEEAKMMQRKLNKDIGGPEKFNSVKVTNKDLKYIQMSMSSTDLQMVEKGVVNLRAVCNVFGLDSSLFNDPANKTFNNRKEAEKALYTNAVIPLSKKISMKHTNYLALNHYPEGNVRMRQDFSSIEALQDDKKQEAEKDKIVMEGINTILNMPITPEAKSLLLTEHYNIPEDQAAIIATTETNEQGE